MTKPQVSQSGVSVAVETDLPNILVSQSGVSVAVETDLPNILVSQSGVSVTLRHPSPNIQVSQFGVSVALCILPEKPTNLNIYVEGNEFVLEWTDNCNFETGYTVEKSFNGTTWNVIATLPADTETYSDTTILDDQIYYYRVEALNGVCGTYSDTVSISTFARFVSCASCQTTFGNEGVVVLDSDGVNLTKIFYTLDGGKSWQYSTSPFSNTQDIISVCAFATNKNTIRWLIAKENDLATSIEIAYSDNAGLTWKVIEVNADIGGAIDSGALFALNVNNVWLGVNDGRIFFSENGGKDWEEQPTSITENIHAIHFADTSYGFAVASNGQVIKTKDGGNTWIRVTDISGIPNVNCVHCFNEFRAIVGTENGYIYMTFNGGDTWIAKKSVDGKITDISFSDDFVGYASATLNHTPTKGRILRTINGGQDWESLYTPLCENINALDIVSTNTAWFVGDESSAAFIIKASG